MSMPGAAAPSWRLRLSGGSLNPRIRGGSDPATIFAYHANVMSNLDQGLIAPIELICRAR